MALPIKFRAPSNLTGTAATSVGSVFSARPAKIEIKSRTAPRQAFLPSGIQLARPSPKASETFLWRPQNSPALLKNPHSLDAFNLAVARACYQGPLAFPEIDPQERQEFIALATELLGGDAQAYQRARAQDYAYALQRKFPQTDPEILMQKIDRSEDLPVIVEMLANTRHLLEQPDREFGRDQDARLKLLLQDLERGIPNFEKNGLDYFASSFSNGGFRHHPLRANWNGYDES